MSRKAWDDLLLEYLTGTLNAAAHAEFERYLAECEPCRTDLAEWQQITHMVRADSEARAGELPPLPAAFYARLRVQPSANGSQPQPMTGRENKMVTMAQEQVKRKRGQGRPVSLAAMVAAMVLGGVLLLASGRFNPMSEVPLAGVNQQGAATMTPTPFISATATPLSVGVDPLLLTATAIIQEATGTAAVEQGLATPINLALMDRTATPTMTPSYQGSLYPMMLTQTALAGLTATPTMTPSYTFTPTPVPANRVTEVALPVVSKMKPIVVMPATALRETEIPVGVLGEGVALSPDGTRLALIGTNGRVWLFNKDTLEAIAVDAFPEAIVERISFSPDNQWLALGTTEGDVILLEAKTGRPAQGIVIDGDGQVTGLAFSPDGGKLLAVLQNAGSLNTLWLYDVETHVGSAVLVYDVPLAGAAFSADGKQILVGTLDGKVLLLAVN